MSPITIALLSLLLLGACSAAPLAVPEDVPSWRAGVGFAEASVVGWKRESQAFGDEFQWRVGDRSLFALTRNNRGNVERRLIEIEVQSLAPALEEGEHWKHVFFFPDKDGKEQSLHSMSMRVLVTISDEQGKVLSACTSEVPEAYLRLGFFKGCKVGEALRARREYRKGKDGSLHLRAPAELYEAVASLQALFAVLVSSKSLRPILEEVVEKPPILVLLPALFSGGISISVAPDFLASKRTPIPGMEGVEAYSFPISFAINDYPGLYARILVAPPGILAPLTGGVVAVEGRHPSHKDIWLSLRLLGSRRAPATETP